MSSLPFACSSAAIAQKEKLGIALVGLGYYGSILAESLQKTKICELKGLVTGTPSKAKLWGSKYNIPEKNIYNYQNFDDIADNPDIDIVYVVLPNSMHKEFSIKAAKAGKHVICEKPMALNVKECEEIIAACNEAKVELGMGYRMHSEPYTQEVKRFAKENVFGKPHLVTSGSGYIMRGNPNQWRLKKDLAGGGALMNMGVYSIQCAIYATGEQPIAVSAQEFKTMPDYFKEVDETITIQLEFPSGCIANLHTSHNANINDLYITYENGWCRLEPAHSYGPIQGETSKGVMDFPVVNQQAEQMDDFAKHILQDAPNLCPGEMGLRDMQIVEAIYKSIDAGGKRIALDLIEF
ncbi:MAG: glucose-fructose oxidoreductase [Thalassobius sp.]|nr:glucose-fructose oxidoreductase [Thalassovita sp.]